MDSAPRTLSNLSAYHGNRFWYLEVLQRKLSVVLREAAPMKILVGKSFKGKEHDEKEKRVNAKSYRCNPYLAIQEIVI